MKRFVMIAGLTVLLVAVVATGVFAAGPRAQATPPAQTGAPGWGMQNGTCPMGGTGMMQGGRPGWAGQPDAVATLLGMTAEEIQAERQAGKSLVQIAAAKGVGEDKLIETILAAKKELLSQAVADGKLTQEQMDLMVEHMQTQIKVMVNRTTVGPMMGGQRGTMPGGTMRGGGMRGGMMRGGGRWQQAPQAPAGTQS